MAKNALSPYKGYIATYELDENVMEFCGIVCNTSDIIHFHASSAEELIASFHESVDAYLEMCQEFGRKPSKPYNGSITLRVPSEFHKKIAEYCIENDISMNNYIYEVLDKELKRKGSAICSKNEKKANKECDIMPMEVSYEPSRYTNNDAISVVIMQ